MFFDQAEFMLACQQTVGIENSEQLALYIKLIEEELQELRSSYESNDKVGVLDAVIDLLVVCIGAGLSYFRPSCLMLAWDEVHRSNMAKIDPSAGMVRKRADGKVLKPEGWRPPDLASIANCKSEQQQEV